MKYQGGKYRIARELREAIYDHGGVAKQLWEPFCGGCGATPQLLQLASNIICSDIQADLINMWQYVVKGWIPPNAVTEEDYRRARQLPETDPLRAFIKVGCSFGGKQWGGFARGLTHDGRQRNYAAESVRNIRGFKRLLDLHQGITFILFDFVRKVYRGLARGTIIYCDPPYAGTTGYGADFDHIAFWKRCEQYARRGMRVYVSEYVAPDGWICLWEKYMANTAGLRRKTARPSEKLFTYRG